MSNSIGGLETMIKLLSDLGVLPVSLLHKIGFCSFAKAGLSLFDPTDSQKRDLEKLIKMIPASYQGLLSGKLYLNALKFIRSLKEFLEGTRRPVILEEANIQFILDFLKEKVGKVGGVIVLDCGSIPELSAIAGKLAYLNRNVTIYDKFFINPVGTTKFLTEQLAYLGRETALKYYAEMLKKELGAKFDIKISTTDLIVHQYGVTIDKFLDSLDIEKIYEQMYHYVKQDSILVTADHGYDLVADEHGLYITHGYKRKCPLNFSRIALFLIID
jgi:hypothetical protein